MTSTLRRSGAVAMLAVAGIAIMRLEWWAFVVVLPAILLAFVLDPDGNPGLDAHEESA